MIISVILVKQAFLYLTPSLILSLLIILCSTAKHTKWYSGGYHFSSQIYFIYLRMFLFRKNTTGITVLSYLQSQS